MTNIIAILFSCIIGFACAYTVSHNVIPFIVKHGMKELEKNPKWINTHIRDKYYGFYDIDIITADSKYGHLPYFRLAKDTLHLEILI